MADISGVFTPALTHSLLVILLTIIIAIVVDNVLRSLIKVPRSIDSRKSRTYVDIFRKTITVVVYSIAVYFISRELGIDLTPLIASAGIVGVVVGIGARALVEDLINGFFLLTQDAVAVGDYVKIDETEGTVEKLGFKSLCVRADSGELHIIPNGLVKRVVNFSNHKSNMFLDFPVKGDQDIDLIIKALNEAMDDLKKQKDFKDTVLDGTEILGISEYNLDGRIIIRSNIITSPEMRYKTALEYRYLVKKNFEKYKIALI